jgi:MFS transporter, SP family, sugar:H+ symporter
MATTSTQPRASRIVFIAVAAALGGFLFGFDTAVVNGAVDAVEETYGTSSFATGFAVAAALLGSAVGAWFAGQLADRIGRLWVMRLTAVVFVISSILTGLAFSVVDFTIWRFIGGVAIGAASVIAPAYIAEISPAAYRGRLGSLQQLAITVGIFVALLSDTILARIAGGANDDLWLGAQAWRWMFMVAAIPAVVYGLMSYRIPESPRYLIHRGDDEGAYAVLREVVPGEEVEGKVEDIKATLNLERRATFADLKGNRFGLLPIIWVGILLSVFQQFVGINVIFYYSNTLWQSVGFSEDDAFITSTITSVTNIAVTFIAIALIDKIGRKRLLLIGSIGMAVTMATLAIVFLTATTQVVDGETQPNLEGFAAGVALVAANLYVVSFGATWGPAVWVLLGEMFNNTIRALGLAIGAAAQWLANFTITLSFPPLSDANVGLPYIIYATMAILSFVFVIRAVPETKGRELEDM